MAIQVRRGKYEDFDPSKLLPGEFADVMSGDPDAADGSSLRFCYSPGNVKRLVSDADVSALLADIASLPEDMTGMIAALREARDDLAEGRESWGGDFGAALSESLATMTYADAFGAGA